MQCQSIFWRTLPRIGFLIGSIWWLPVVFTGENQGSDGRARPLPETLSCLRDSGSTNSLCHQWNQLLPEVPNRGKTPGRSDHVETSEKRRAAYHRRTWGPEAEACPEYWRQRSACKIKWSSNGRYWRLNPPKANKDWIFANRRRIYLNSPRSSKKQESGYRYATRKCCYLKRTRCWIRFQSL